MKKVPCFLIQDILGTYIHITVYNNSIMFCMKILTGFLVISSFDIMEAYDGDVISS